MAKLALDCAVSADLSNYAWAFAAWHSKNIPSHRLLCPSLSPAVWFQRTAKNQYKTQQQIQYKPGNTKNIHQYIVNAPKDLLLRLRKENLHATVTPTFQWCQDICRGILGKMGEAKIRCMATGQAPEQCSHLPKSDRRLSKHVVKASLSGTSSQRSPSHHLSQADRLIPMKFLCRYQNISRIYIYIYK